MCRLKSGIILKDEVFVPDYDHHTNMLAELEIEDNEKNASTRFVRAELYPENDDVFTDPETWIFHVDQDIRPDWFVEDYERERFIKAVKKWWAAHVFIGKDDLELPAGFSYYLKGCKRATLRGNSTATLRGNSTATMLENSTATLWENSTATLWENSTATLRGNSFAMIESNCYAGRRENVLVLDNSTLKDCRARTIWQSGDFKVVVSDDEEVPAE